MKRRRKGYTAAGLRRAAERYFAAISRTVPVTETADTGQRDEKGRPVPVTVPVKNRLGEPVYREEYILPPSVADLCLALGLHRSDWRDCCDPERDPALAEETVWIRERIEAWALRELLTRPGKDLKGILCCLENGCFWPERAGEREDGDPLAGLDLSRRLALVGAARRWQEGEEDGDD